MKIPQLIITPPPWLAIPLSFLLGAGGCAAVVILRHLTK